MDHDDDIEYIQNKLCNLDVFKNINSSRKLMKRIISASCSGLDTSIAFPAVAKLLACNDLILKKLSHWYIRDHADNDDLILLVINTLLKDCKDPNPTTRAIAIKTLTNMPKSVLSEYGIQSITLCLSDANAYVRRAAVLATIRVHETCDCVISETSWVDHLYKLIKDSDPIVVTSCLHALSVILENHGGLVVNRNMAHYLLNRLSKFPDYHVLPIISALHKYSPRSEDETLEIMNILDDYLKSTQSAIVIRTMEYFLKLINNMPQLRSELYLRSSEQIRELLGTANSELAYELLEYIEGLLDHVDMSKHYKVFLCKYSDPQYLKNKRIGLLPRLTSQDNISDILEELKMYCLDATTRKTAIQTLCNLAHAFPSNRNQAVDSLIQLLQWNPAELCDDILRVFHSIDLHDIENRTKIFHIIEDTAPSLTSDAGRISLAGFLSKYGEYMENSPYTMEDLCHYAVNNSSVDLCVAVLSAIVRLFLKRPAECQNMLGVFFEHCLMHSSATLRDKAIFYYRLLETDPCGARTVMGVKIL